MVPHHHHHHRLFLINVQLQCHVHVVDHYPGDWLAARMACRTSDLHSSLLCGSTASKFHSLRSRSAISRHVNLGLPGPRVPSTIRSLVVLIAPVDLSTCAYHRRRLSRMMILMSSRPSFSRSDADLTSAVSSALPDAAHLPDHGVVVALKALDVGLGHWPI